MLTGVEIKQRTIVHGGENHCYRASSYDLRIGKLINPDGESVDSYKLPAQGIVEVISKEIICMPNDVAGLAMVKTSLCSEGLLALNIGILDPGYNGPISSFLINFGKNERLLTNNEVFLRLCFHPLAGVTPLVTPVVKNYETYVADKRRQIALLFGSSFLNISQVIEEFTEQSSAKYRNRVLGYVSAGALALASITFFLNFGNLLLVQRWLQPSDTAKSSLLQSNLERQTRELVDQNRALNVRIEQLERQIQKQLPTVTHPVGGVPSSAQPVQGTP